MNTWILIFFALIIFYEFYKVIRWCMSPKNAMKDKRTNKKLSQLIILTRPLLKELGIEYITLIPSYSHKSYTRNKEKIFLSFYDYDGNERPFEDLVEIFIHEVTHLTSEKHDPNHGPEFQKSFKKLVKRCIQLKILDDSNCLFTKGC